MTSRIETSGSSELLTNKISIMLEDLNKEYADFSSLLKEDIIMSFDEVVKRFFSTIEKPLFFYREIRRGSTPNIEELNKYFTASGQDIRIIYSELSSIRKKLASNFNSLSSTISKIKGEVAFASSELIDYKIQNTDKVRPTFVDIFNDLSKIENDDKFYSADKSFIDTKNNRGTLPLEGEANTLILKKIKIAEDSIGSSGNNQEVGVVARDNLKLLYDDNLDTWFEFEQVDRDDILIPTVLNLRLDFDKESIFNIVDISAVQFPIGTSCSISAIKGSADGSAFFDLMPSFLGKKEIDSLGNEIIQLGDTPSNPSDSNALYFSPKKIQALTIKLIEDSSYSIRTSSGIKNRSAIGIREIKVKAQKFKSKGQLITTNLQSAKEISKIAIETDETKPENFDSTLDYFISIDNGENWEEISPTQQISEDKPEVLNYNIDFLESSKKTDTPVKTVKLKADFSLETSPDVITKSSTFKRINKSEFHSIGTGSKTILLTEKPIDGVSIHQINLGSVGSDSSYKFIDSDIIEDDRITAQLPTDIFGHGSILKNQEIIFSDGRIWERVEDLSTSGSTDLHYSFDYINNIATFYLDDGTKHGKKPIEDILIKLDRENPILVDEGNTLKIETVFNTDGVKENIRFYKLDKEEKETETRLRNKATVHRLMIDELLSVQVSEDTNLLLNTEKDYINGVLELNTSGDYSVDYKNNILYTFREVYADETVKVLLTHKDRKEIDVSIDLGKVYFQKKDYQKDQFPFDLDISAATYVIDLGIKNIEPKSIQFNKYTDQLGSEVSLQDMDIVFQGSDVENPYSVDYRNGLIYLKNSTLGNITGILSASDYFIEYNIGDKIPEEMYTVAKESKAIDLSDRYVVKYFSNAVNSVPSPTLFRVEYDYAKEIKESAEELLKYTTPFLNSYKITTTPKGLLV